MNTIKFSVVERLMLTNKLCDIDQLESGLKGDRMKNLIEPIRKLIAEGKKEEADILKNKLPAIIPSGIFTGGRSKNNIEEYSHIVCLDLDKLDPAKVKTIKATIENCEYTLLGFVSPSGIGLKIFVKVNSGLNYHKHAYKQVLKYYTALIGEKFDEKTSDINRLMFMSYDPEVYHYPDSLVFSVVTPIGSLNEHKIVKPVVTGTVDESFFDKVYKTAYEWICNKEEYIEGNRNNFVHRLACSCNRYGLPLEELDKRLEWCELPKEEIKTTINSCYKNNEEHGTWRLPEKQKSLNMISEPKTELTEDTWLGKSPTIPKEVYDLLPNFLKGITAHFTEGVDKDLVLLSSLGVLSSAFPKTKGLYERSTTALNLFTLMVAPPASGKGQMKWAELLLKKVDNHLNKEFKQKYAIYKKSGEEAGFQEPMKKKMFIGADSSIAALAKQMDTNESFGIIYDTEGSTLSQMFRNEWSNYTNLLLKAFQNEPYSQDRKLDTITIEKTFLSLVLSTTPKQVVNILEGIENGLYSRFLVYYFEGNPVWKDQFCSEGDSLEPFFNSAAEEVLKMWKLNEKGPDTLILLSDEQRIAINDYFKVRFEEFKSEYNLDLLSSVKRTCLICYRIAMILTTIRKYEALEVLPEKITIDDRDYRAAQLIVDTLLEHVKIVYESIVKEKPSGLIGKKKILAYALPVGEFKRSDYLELSHKLEIKKATADLWLNNFQRTGIVIKLEHGRYRRAC